MLKRKTNVGVGSAEQTTSHWTREMAKKIKATTFNTFPPFDPMKFKPLMPEYHVWDSWFVMTEDNQVAVFNGYKILIALVRNEDADDAERIAYFYTKDGVHYHVGGFLFETQIYPGAREWSGSTILRKDGKLQTFYTVAAGTVIYGIWQTRQRFATAVQTLYIEDDDELKVKTPELHHIIKEPDGMLYETPEQASSRESKLATAHRRDFGSDQTENFCFRDPKFFKDSRTGKAYLIFEGNTGPDSFPPGVVHERYIGATQADYSPTIDDLKANGCVGVIELTNDDYTFGEFKQPWLTANLVTDEIERINVIEYNGYYYLFVVGHGNKNTLIINQPDLNNRDYLLGFRADRLFGELQPLNESGVVVQQASPGRPYEGQENNEQYVYSWLLVPGAKSDRGIFDCISYANFSVSDEHKLEPLKTSGPTVEIKLDGLKTQIVGLKYDILAQ